jgi:hypothetical protein
MSKSKAKQARRKAAASGAQQQSPPSRGTQPAAARAQRPQPVSLRRLAPVFITGIFLIGIFLLPYHVPLHDPSNSQSWEFGFNNTVAQGLIALLLLSLFAWQYFFGEANLEEDPVVRTLREQGEGEPLQVRPLLATMGILQLVTTAVLLAWYAALPMTHYGEFTYFIQRVEASILGRVPYVDFAFDYGPAMLAIPVAIYRLFHGSISVEAAYAATLILHFIVGFALVTYVISQINARGRVIILAMVGFEWINITMGLQYTPLRFTVALASLFAIRHIHRLTSDNPRRRMVLLALAGFLTPLISFSISPEMGLALTISLCVYFAWFLFGPERRLAVLAASVLAGVGLAVMLFPRAYFDSILSFGKGGANFPIFPTMHILTFLAAAIWVFPRLGLVAIRDRSAGGPFCAGLAILCGLLILPATGRCDPGHVWINSMGIMIIALGGVSWLAPRLRYSLWGIYFIIFPVTCQISFWDHYKQPVEGALSVRDQLAEARAGGLAYDADNYDNLAPGSPLPPIHYSKLLPMGGELKDLPEGKIGLPLGGDEAMERYLVLTGRAVPEYHIAPYSDIFGAADLERKYQDLRAMDYIFVPAYYLNYLRPVNPVLQARAQGEADCKFMTSLLLFPVDLPVVHPLFQPEAEIVRHIYSDYQAGKYTLYKKMQQGILLKRVD